MEHRLERIAAVFSPPSAVSANTAILGQNASVAEFLSSPSLHYLQIDISEPGSVVSVSTAPCCPPPSAVRSLLLAKSAAAAHDDAVMDSLTMTLLPTTLLPSIYAHLSDALLPLLAESSSSGALALPPNLKVAKLLTQLQKRLGVALRVASLKAWAGGEAESAAAPLEASVLTPADELKVWKRAASGGGDGAAVWTALAPVAGPVARFGSAPLGEQMDTLDALQDALDDVWRLDIDPVYPQARMAHFMEVMCHAVGAAAGSVLGASVPADDPTALPGLFRMAPAQAKGAAAAAARLTGSWRLATGRLTGVVWHRMGGHPWKGSPFASEYLDAVSARISELSSMLSAVGLLLSLVPQVTASGLGLPDRASLFAPFAGVYLLELNVANPGATAYATALKSFASAMAPLEAAVADTLASRLRALMSSSPQQLVHACERHMDVLLRPGVFAALSSLREEMAGALAGVARSLSAELDKLTAAPASASDLTGLSLPSSVGSLVAAQSIQARAERARSVATPLIGSLPTGAAAVADLNAVRDAALAFVDAGHAAWVEDVLAGVHSDELGLELTGKVMALSGGDGSMVVSFSPRLVALLREVRVLRGLGLPVPDAASAAYAVGSKYYRYGMVLRQVASLYNNLDSEIIFSQMPMMMDAAQEFEALIQDASGRASWDDEPALAALVDSLQAAAAALSATNRRLRAAHFALADKVLALMGTSLLLERDAWRDGVAAMNSAIAALSHEGYGPRMDGWIAHWNQQLFKALEVQYRVGLETLNSQLPTIHASLVFKAGGLAFEPPFEELRLKYYAALKKFVALPLKFRGVGTHGSSIFAGIIAKNGPALRRVYIKAESLFDRLNAVRAPFEEWVALGRVDTRKWIDATFTSLADWELNFRALKSRGKAFDKALPDSVSVDCVTVSTVPAKSAIDGFMRSFADALVSSLKDASRSELAALQKYMDDGSALMTSRPESVSEIGEAKGALARLSAAKKDMLKLRSALQAKSKLLRTVVGGGIDLSTFEDAWEQFEIGLDAHAMLIESQASVLKSSLSTRAEELNAAATKLAAHWEDAQPSGTTLADPAAAKAAASVVADYQAELAELETTGATLRSDCEHFALPPPELAALDELSAAIASVASVWALFSDYSDALAELTSQDWYSLRAKLYLFEDFISAWSAKLSAMTKGGGASSPLRSGGRSRGVLIGSDSDSDASDADDTGVDLGNVSGASQGAVASAELDTDSPIFRHISGSLALYKRTYPLLKYARGDAFTGEHWSTLFRLLGLPRGLRVSDLTFGHLVGALDAAEASSAELKALHDRAEAEVTVRSALAEMDAWGAELQFTLLPPSESRGVRLITEWRDLLTELGDKQSLLQSLKDSRMYSNFANAIDGWEARTAALDSALSSLNAIQRKWVYLEPIFSKGALPSEAPRFKRIDDDFVSVLSSVEADPRVLSLLSYPGLSDLLAVTLDQLERAQRALAAFLESKRSAFPRFYFIGDDDLLEILGQSTNPAVIQSHLKKLFAGIASVTFNEATTAIVAFNSSAGETVALNPPLVVGDQVEAWLGELVSAMRGALAASLATILAAGPWDGPAWDAAALARFPSQMLSLAENIGFCAAMDAVLSSGASSAAAGLDSLRTVIQGKIAAYTAANGALGRSAADRLTSAKIKNLVLELVHNADVVDQVAADAAGGTRLSPSSWVWAKQLRYGVRSQTDGPLGGPDVAVYMGDAEFEYTYEYQGNVSKLVHTPLTDKCYLTLTQGMAFGYGGNPYGPAGTGKTESIKALGAGMGRQVLVFNCDEGIDFKSMGRIFTGLVKCGAWGCFDEFNRLDEVVLSAVSQQIQTIQTGIKARSRTVHLLGSDIELDANSGIFVTMNPAGKGYGGRSKLPDNLKQLFRPVAMSRPDLELIAEVILFAEGFTDARTLARKLVSIYELNRELLSAQQHYDWGLRALKAVLSLGGTLLARERAARSGALDVTVEHELVVKALRSNTLSKLTYSDSVLFEGLVGDLFPGVAVDAISYAELEDALEAELAERGLARVPRQLTKLLQLYEATTQRMGVVIVGPSGSGKTTLWRVLAGALNRLSGPGSLVTHVLNPKSMPRAQLLGSLDLDTREWTDGVLTAAARNVVSTPPGVSSWIVCDGDVDPKWIESLNSVLDDNRLLTMPNGERIQFGSNVNFVFETHDLTYASPATVSRMGMIFLSDAELTLEALVSGWAGRVGAPSVQVDWMMDVLPRALADTAGKGIAGAALTRVGVLRSVTRSLGQAPDALSKSAFFDRVAAGVVAGCGPGVRAGIRKAVYTGGGMGPSPLPGFVPPALSVDDVLSGALVETASAQACLATIVPLLKEGHPVVVAGPGGSGKSLLLASAFRAVQGSVVSVIHCSAQTDGSDLLRKLYEGCIAVNSNRGRVLRPKGGSRLIVFLKDVNMATPDEYGTQQLGALLHQLLTYSGFYSAELEWVNVEGVVFAASMSPATTLGRYDLSPRLASLMTLYQIDYPSGDELTAVASAYLAPVVGQVCPSGLGAGGAGGAASALASALVKVYSEVRRKFSVDEHRHYLFTPRDLMRTITGLLRYVVHDDEGMDGLLDVVSAELRAVFGSRLVDERGRSRLDAIIASVLRGSFNYDAAGRGSGGVLYSSWAPEAGGASAASGSMLGAIPLDAFAKVVQSGLKAYERDRQVLKLKIFPQMLAMAASYDRALSAKDGTGHVLAVGPAGTGKSSLLKVVGHMHGYEIGELAVGKPASLKEFQVWLKGMLLRGGVDGQPVLLVIRDSCVFASQVLEAINALLASGSVPGLFTPDELDGVLAPLRSSLADEGFYGTLAEYFALRVRKYVHVALVMDPRAADFAAATESNPALYGSAQVLWTDGWSKDSMKRLPRVLLKKLLGKATGRDEVLRLLRHMHTTAPGARMPRKFALLLATYSKVLKAKSKSQSSQASHLSAGLSKLAEAAQAVDELGAQAAEQELKLAEKEAKADAALSAITTAVENASAQRQEMEVLEAQLGEEEAKLAREKAKIDAETAEVQPKLEAAKSAVGSLDRKSLTEARSMPNPPSAVRDVLTVVLQMMGFEDTSWKAMRSFLGRKGLTEEILSFSAVDLPSSKLARLESLVDTYGASFEPSTIQHASRTIAPMAAWVLAQLDHARVLREIEPLMKAQAKLEKGMAKASRRVEKLQTELAELDDKVARLKKEFKKRTREAEKLQSSLEAVQSKKEAADTLLGQLSGERTRWAEQLEAYAQAQAALPLLAALAAGFLVYLPSQPEDVRSATMGEWRAAVSEVVPEVADWNVASFLSSEAEQLLWKSEGLAADSLSVENAAVILHAVSPRVIIDPSGMALRWLKARLSTEAGGSGGSGPGDVNDINDDDDDDDDDDDVEGKGKGRVVEVVSANDPRFTTKLELAVRFGKTLVVENMDRVDPLLVPLLRGDKTLQGTRSVVAIGDKKVDYDKAFELFMVSRDARLALHPDVLSVVTEVNFTVTRSGLESQLLGLTLEHEQPQLEEQKSVLLREEESHKMELAGLEKSLLENLATSSGNLLEDTSLVASLNETKAKAEAISGALTQSRANQAVLDEQREAYRPIAHTGSQLYFLVSELEELDAMYVFSLSSFVELFHAAFGEGSSSNSSSSSSGHVDGRLLELQSRLLRLVYGSVSRSLFKDHRLTFGLHLVHGLRPELFRDGEWALLVSGVTGGTGSGDTPSWVPSKRAPFYGSLKSLLPGIIATGNMVSDSVGWSQWLGEPEPETAWPSSGAASLSEVEKLIVLLALRPDRFVSALHTFVETMLSVSGGDATLETVARQIGGRVPALLIATAGADPSAALEDLARETVGLDAYYQLAMGQGQGASALKVVREAARKGGWVTLKNLHLVLPWVQELAGELASLDESEIAPSFKLWLTTEAHPKFPRVLASSCVKMTVEAPPGLKRNLQRTLSRWSGIDGSGLCQVQALFGLAVFHGLVQERRSYMPQGWSKFYEFSEADLRVGQEVLCSEASRGGPIEWAKVVGLFESAIYGGRVDNAYDMRVLHTYLRRVFCDGTVPGREPRHGAEVAPGLAVPSKDTIGTLRTAVSGLPETDDASIFGLPANISRSVEQAVSARIVEQLRALSSGTSKRSGFDRDEWSVRLSGVLHQWERLTRESGVLDIEVGSGTPSTSGSPVAAFLELELQQGVDRVQRVDRVLSAVSDVLEERALVTPELIRLGDGGLLSGRVPEEWYASWEGPLNLSAWLAGVVGRTVAVAQWRSRGGAGTEVRLDALFRPGTFLNAVRQETARSLGAAMDELVLVSSLRGDKDWAGALRVGGLLLQGASYEGGRGVRPASGTTASFVSLPPVTVAWVPSSEASAWKAQDSVVQVALYSDSEREQVVVEMDVEIEVGGAADAFVLAGMALFLT